MSTYSSKRRTAALSVEAAYDRLSHPSRFQEMLQEVPDEVKARMGDIHFTDDEIVLGTRQVGNIVLRATRRERPGLIQYTAQGSPVPIALEIHLEPREEDSCEVWASISLEIPAMLRPLIGSKMQDAADKFGELLAALLK